MSEPAYSRFFGANTHPMTESGQRSNPRDPSSSRKARDSSGPVRLPADDRFAVGITAHLRQGYMRASVSRSPLAHVLYNAVFARLIHSGVALNYIQALHLRRRDD